MVKKLVIISTAALLAGTFIFVAIPFTTNAAFKKSENVNRATACTTDSNEKGNHSSAVNNGAPAAPGKDIQCRESDNPNEGAAPWIIGGGVTLFATVVIGLWLMKTKK